MVPREAALAMEPFFASCREAFERADVAAVAEHFGESVHGAVRPRRMRGRVRPASLEDG